MSFDHTRYEGVVAYVAKNPNGTDRAFGFIRPAGTPDGSRKHNVWFGHADEFKRGDAVTFELYDDQTRNTDKSIAACRVRRSEDVDQLNEV